MLALTISGIVWFYTNGIKPMLSVDSVIVLAFDSQGETVVANTGGTAVYVSKIAMFMVGRDHDWTSAIATLDEMLGVGQLIRKDLAPSKESWTIVRGRNPDAFEDVIVKAANNDPCFIARFFVEKDPTLQDIRGIAGPTLNTFPSTGYLQYWSLRNPILVRVPLRGTGIVEQSTSRSGCSQK